MPQTQGTNHNLKRIRKQRGYLNSIQPPEGSIQQAEPNVGKVDENETVSQSKCFEEEHRHSLTKSILLSWADLL